MNDRIHIQITDEPIVPERVLSLIRDPAQGAEVAFFGVIRDHNVGKRVLAVSYDVFDALAESTFRDLCREALARWGPGLRLAVIHRKGKLAVGEISIAIVVGSAHRDEAYQASRFIIEEVKHKAPIWKKEHFEGGESEWVQGHSLCH